MTPTEILDAMAEAYASCVSYRDTGSVATRYIYDDPTQDSESVMPFRTAFVRPDRFRFEFSDEEQRCVVWSQGKEVRTWWDVSPGVEEHESLETAVAAATGVSGGAAHTVPAFLLPDQVRGRRLHDGAAEAASICDEVLSGVTCYRLALRWDEDPATLERHRQEIMRITGEPPERHVDGPLLVWIDRGTFQIRRIEESTQFETFRTETVTTYDPAFGVPIGDDELRFDPPGG